MKVGIITATKNRHKQLERVVKFVMNQTYTDWTHIIYNNAVDKLRLNNNLPADKFLLINNNINLKTHKPYENLGDIYNDILKYIPSDIDVICFADDDDIFLPNHLEEGIKGLEKHGKLAYKPEKSYFLYQKKCSLSINVFEPSIFVKASHIKEYGFSPETTAQHHQWLQPLLNKGEIIADPEGIPTYICDWSQEIPTFKTSGDPHNPNNFNNYTTHSQDKGDSIITPCSQSWADHYYRKIEKCQK